jgi:hypothetical protein
MNADRLPVCSLPETAVSSVGYKVYQVPLAVDNLPSVGVEDGWLQVGVLPLGLHLDGARDSAVVVASSVPEMALVHLPHVLGPNSALDSFEMVDLALHGAGLYLLVLSASPVAQAQLAVH